MAIGCGVVDGPSGALRNGSVAPPIGSPRTVAPANRTGLLDKPPAHVVVVIEENHAYSEIAGNPSAPYINALMKRGAKFTQYHGVEHPSEPNYLDLFSGWNQGVTDDSSPHTFSTGNLASELIAAHLTFKGYSEGLPSVGYTGVAASWLSFGASYARKHNPWVNFTNVPSRDNVPLTAFPKDFNQLPTVSFVIPNLANDMHNGSIATGDAWLKQHLSAYADWAQTHNSLLLVTWDEDDQSANNHIATLMVGEMVRPVQYNQPLNHFNLLRTVEDLYRLPHLGKSTTAAPITGVWRNVGVSG